MDLNLRTVMSADGTRVFFNNKGNIFLFVTATNSFSSASQDSGCCSGDYELAIAANESQVEASSYLYDFSLEAAATLTLNDREVLDVSYVYGNKLSPDGALLFQPSTQGMDIFDGRLGILRSRIAFDVPLSTNYDAVVSDGKDNVLIVITGTSGNGIAVLDLSSLPESAAPLNSAEVSDPPDAGRTSGTASTNSGPSAHAKERVSWHRVPHVSNAALFRK